MDWCRKRGYERKMKKEEKIGEGRRTYKRSFSKLRKTR